MPGLNWNAMVAIHFCRGELSTFSPLALSFSEVKRTWAVSPKNAMEVIFTTTLPLSFNTDRGEPGACTLREYSLATSPSHMSLHASNCSEMVNQSYPSQVRTYWANQYLFTTSSYWSLVSRTERKTVVAPVLLSTCKIVGSGSVRVSSATRNARIDTLQMAVDTMAIIHAILRERLIS